VNDPDVPELVNLMRRKGIPLTRENYIHLSGGATGMTISRRRNRTRCPGSCATA
jgi:hypothetical protein